MKIITVAVQKGGTGKTATAAALAQASAYKGQRVLAIDLDPQGNLTFALKGQQNGTSSCDVLHGTPAEEAIQATECGVDLIPASQVLALEKTGKGSVLRLKKALDDLEQPYDRVIIDTPPTAGELQYNALYAATELVIPLQADAFCLQSLYQIAETAGQIGGENLDFSGLVFTKADMRSILARQMRENIIKAANRLGISYLGTIRSGIAVQETAALQRSLYDYAPKSKPAADYLELMATIEETEAQFA